MKTIKRKRARLSRVVVKEVSLCDKAANPYATICMMKRDYESLLDAASERHRARIDRALRDATSRRQFDKRLAKSRAKFDGDVAEIMQGLAPANEDAGENPPLEEQMGQMQARAGAKFPDEDPAVAFEKYLGTAEGRQMHADYRNLHLRSVLKSYSPYPSRPTQADGADVAGAKDEEDGLDPDEALEQCEKRVSELVARGASPGAAWDEVSITPMFKSAKRLVVGKVGV